VTDCAAAGSACNPRLIIRLPNSRLVFAIDLKFIHNALFDLNLFPETRFTTLSIEYLCLKYDLPT
jgi:hypothetical protein